MKVRGKALRTGWTTGTCSAAAAKAASIALSSGAVPPRRRHPAARRRPHDARRRHPARSRPDGRRPSSSRTRATIPTSRTAPGSPRPSPGARRPGIELDGGVGVGVVTKPGLGLEVGGPAINPVPRAQITASRRRGDRPCRRKGFGSSSASPTASGWPARPPTAGSASSAASRSSAPPASCGRSRPHRGAPPSCRPSMCWPRKGERTVVLATGGRTEKAAMALYPGAGRELLRRGRRLHRRRAAPGPSRRAAAGHLRRHGRQADQARRRRADDPLHALGGRPRTARRHHGRGGRRRRSWPRPSPQANTARHAYEIWESHELLQARRRRALPPGTRGARTLHRGRPHRRRW